MVMPLDKNGEVLEIDEALTRRPNKNSSNNGSNSGPKNDGNSTNPKKSTTTRAWIGVVVIVLIVAGIVCTKNDASSLDNDRNIKAVQQQQKTPKQWHNKPHTGSSFGGVNNIAQPAGAKAAAALAACEQLQEQADDDNDKEQHEACHEGQGEMTAALQQIHPADITIPRSNVGHAIPSLNWYNILNHVGHYVHDEHRSPYASHLYAGKTRQELEAEQAAFVQKMQKVRDTWGAWDFNDPSLQSDDRPQADLESAPYKDLPAADFPPWSWQADPDYVQAFIQQGRALVERMTEGIYAEYGWPLNKTDGTQLTSQELQERQQAFQINLVEDLDIKNPAWGGKVKGVATLYQSAMQGLVRKLLHSMMTHNEFYVVLAGHSAAAGHGNDFMQNRIMAFHRIMEPVFDKLGMRLVSRNMGMGGVGTLQFSMAGGDLYGETDIIEWDSGMTEKGGPSVDLFNKQAILSGERVPLIMTYYQFNIAKETNGTAWMGKYTDDTSMMPPTTLENVETVPYAARWIWGQQEKYNAICWEPRTEFQPSVAQVAHPGSQVSWHPGFRYHQWQGRRLALIVLKALSMAFDVWEEGTQQGGYPLSDSYWHVGETYKSIREQLRTHITTPVGGGEGTKDDVRSPCEKMIPWLPRICRVQMHGFGMWTPRHSSEFDLLKIIKPAPNGYKPFFRNKNVYDGFDLLPYAQKIPDGEVDVHAIAIATTNPPPDLDHSWVDDDDEKEGADTSTETTPTRRMLQEGTKWAVRTASAAAAAAALTKKDAMEYQQSHLRRLQDSAGDDSVVVPGRGWEALAWSPVEGRCDGSAQSECGRTSNQQCLLYGANDNHMHVNGNTLSGWLVFSLPKVKEGIVLARMEWWGGGHNGNSLTQGWTEVNNGETVDTTPWNQTRRELSAPYQVLDPEEAERRRLGKASIPDFVPPDLKMDIAINGKITKTMEREEWVQYVGEYVKNVALWPLLNDESMAQRDWDGEPMEVAIRFRSELKPQQGYTVSHIYYA